MSNDLTARPRVPTPDNAAREDGLLIHDLTVANTMIGRYVLRFLDAESISIAAEQALADRLTDAAKAIQARAIRRASSKAPNESLERCTERDISTTDSDDKFI
jgi:hypothetical protein